MAQCPCGTEMAYDQCCGQYIQGASWPKTPKLLMRSRYTAYSRSDMDYIVATMRGKPLQGFDRHEALMSSEHVRWLKLEVLNAPPYSKTKGTVEFKAHYLAAEKPYFMHEISEFRFKSGRWYYVDGVSQVN